MSQTQLAPAARAKRNALMLLAIVGALTVILAMSLQTVTLSPGQPFNLGQPQLEASSAGGFVPSSEVLFWLIQGLLAVGLIILPVYIVYSLLSAEGRRRLVVNMILIGLLFLLADYLHNQVRNNNAQPRELQLVRSPNGPLGSDLPTTPFPNAPPAWLTPMVMLVVAIVIVAVVVVAIRFFRQGAKMPEPSLEKLAAEAHTALESLHAGADFKVTVIRCYQEMLRVVKDERGIARDAAMTAREFEERLTGKGLPPEPVQTLTRIFEQVRYSSLTADSQQEQLAFTCLTAIANACHTIGAGHGT